MTTTWKRPEGSEESREEQRQKVEDDLDIDEDVMKLHQHSNGEESSDPKHHIVDIDQLRVGSNERAPTIRSEARRGNWGTRSNAQENVIDGSSVKESKSYAAADEGR